MICNREWIPACDHVDVCCVERKPKVVVFEEVDGGREHQCSVDGAVADVDVVETYLDVHMLQL